MVQVILSELVAAQEFWRKIAADNGWTIGSMTVWADADGHITDSVAVLDGDGLYIVPTNVDDEEEGEG